MPSIQNFGSGIGLLYITDLNNNIVTNVPNNEQGVDQVKHDALNRAPVAADINAIGSVTITSAVADNTTGLTINGIAQIGASVANTTGDEEQTAIDIATAVNSYIPASGGNYVATAIGAKIVLSAPSSLGSTVNGHVVAVAFDGATTATKVDVAGGQDGSGVNSDVNGRKYYINANVSAPQGSLTGATEITVDLIMRGLQHRIDEETNTIAVGVIAPTRTLALMHINVDTEGAAGSDNLDSIDIGGYVLGDIIIVSGVASTRVVTVRDTTVSGGNIKLAGATPYDTGSKNAAVTLRLVEDSVLGTMWYELYRSPAVAITAETFLDAGVPIVAGTQEVDIAGVGLPYLQTLSAVSPLSPSFTNIVDTTPATLTADFNIALPAVGTATDGQQFTVKFDAVGTDVSGAGDVIIFGNTLTTQEALSGGLVFTAIKNTDANAWEVTKYVDFQVDAVIATSKLIDKAVTDVKLANDAAVDANRAVGTDHIKDDAVVTAKILDANITNAKIADQAVTVEKLDTEERLEIMTFPVSFVSGSIGLYQFTIPYKCDVIEVFSRVTTQIEATDKAYIDFANGTGNMADGQLCHAGGAAFGDQQSDTPTTNQEILAGGVLKATTSKVTPGGTAMVTVHLQRKP